MAIASRDIKRANDFARQHDIPTAVSSYDDVINSAQVDAVYIPLPTAAHFEWCKKALLAGKHVLCEKPIAMSAAEVDGLIVLRDQTGLICGEAFMVAHHPQWVHVRESIASGAIGDLTLVEGSFTYFNDDPDALKNNRALGGGGVRDIGVYPLVTTRFATGLEPIHVQSDVRIDARFGTDSLAVCNIEFPGFQLCFYCGTQMSRRQHMVFHGTKGWLSLEAPFNPGVYGAAKVSRRSDDSEKVEVVDFGPVDQYQMMVENFAAAVMDKDTAFAFTLESSRANQLIIDLILAHPRGN